MAWRFRVFSAAAMASRWRPVEGAAVAMGVEAGAVDASLWAVARTGSSESSLPQGELLLCLC